MTHHQIIQSSCELVTELIGALTDIDALGQLSHDRLASLTTLTESQLDVVGDFGIECRVAWDLARPPTSADLAELSDSPTGIDWDDDEDAGIVWASLAVADGFDDRETGEGLDADISALAAALTEVDRLPRKVAA